MVGKDMGAFAGELSGEKAEGKRKKAEVICLLLD
jgi:hypothetical protein